MDGISETQTDQTCCLCDKPASFFVGDRPLCERHDKELGKEIQRLSEERGTKRISMRAERRAESRRRNKIKRLW